MRKIVIQKNTYRDSVNLMLLSDRVRKLPGIKDVAVLMATPANKHRLAAAGYKLGALEKAGAEDLCIGIEAEGKESLDAALHALEEFIAGKTQSTGASSTSRHAAPHTISSAVKALPGAQLVSISLPGEYAAAETRKALEMGLHAFLFSDNVTLQDEKELKLLARQRGLLLMGPDCGTALINGFPLGFCNLVPGGPVGLVAASGTGAQELLCLLADQGVGVSKVLGTGGRDLSKEIGGLSFETALHALDQDEHTRVIILVSKPPDPAVETRILKLVEGLDKDVVICFIGQNRPIAGSPRVFESQNLTHAAQIAAALIKKQALPTPLTLEHFIEEHRLSLEMAHKKLLAEQRFVRGLFTGGTLADEVAWILAEYLPEVHAGDGFGPVQPIDDWENSRGNLILDLGDDRFTLGRPHPMIDPTIRLERIRKESQDPTVAVLLLDVILGLNADQNPAERLAPTLQRARQAAEGEGRSLPFVVHICGTMYDPQNLAEQTHLLEQAGCLVFRSNVEAALAVIGIIQGVELQYS